MLTPSQIQDYYTTQNASKTPLSPAQYEASLAKPAPTSTTAPMPPAPSTSSGQAVPPANPSNPNNNATPSQTITSPTANPQNNPASAGKPGYDVFGAPVAGGAAPAASSTATSTPPVGGTDANGNALLGDQADRQALDQANADYQTQAKQVQDTITNIQNGTTPLTAGEQAQVDGLKQQFQTLIDAQTLQNTGAFGVAQMRGYQSGAAEYDPTFQVKTIGSIVSAGNAKIADLAIKEASAVATLTQALRDNDIKAVQDAWSVYKDASTARTTALQKVIDSTQKAIADAADAKAKADQYNLDVEKFQQTKDQNAFDNAFKIEQEKFDEQYKKDTLALDKFKAGEGAGGGGVGVGSSAHFGADGNIDPASQKAVLDQITAKYGPMTAIAIQGLADYSLNPADWRAGAAKGMSRDQAVTLAKMYDPTYNDAMFPTRAQYMKNLASSQTGTVGSAVNSANKAINHLTAYVTEMGQIGNGPISFGNYVGNTTWGQLTPAKRQAIAAAQTEGLGVAEELAKFFKGSGTVDVTSIDAWKGQLSTNASPADVRGLTQGAVTLLEGQLETLAEQYTSTMGKAPETDFLNPSARASLSSLKNQGYVVDIPGINYTDKNAYIKYDGNAQANMQTAIDQLTASGLPLTPDNILQLAQSQ